jgi:hypothetical protein
MKKEGIIDKKHRMVVRQWKKREGSMAVALHFNCTAHSDVVVVSGVRIVSARLNRR